MSRKEKEKEEKSNRCNVREDRVNIIYLHTLAFAWIGIGHWTRGFVKCGGKKRKNKSNGSCVWLKLVEVVKKKQKREKGMHGNNRR